MSFSSACSRNLPMAPAVFSFRSHLLTAMTSARPSRSTRSAMRWSCSSKAFPTSSSTTTTSAKRMALSASATDSFSSFSSTRERRRRPAVSCSWNFSPCQSSSTAIESRVVPASGAVSRRSSPISRLISVDLPALGRPTMATRIGCRRPSGAASSSAGLRGQFRRRGAQRVVEIGHALIVLGRNRHRLAKTKLVGRKPAAPRLRGPRFCWR